jgi:hypothetical protein
MALHDIVNNIGIEQSLMPQTIIASALNSGNIDMLGAEALAVVVLVGNTADTLSGSVRIDLKIEHAEDNGSGAAGAYAACTDEDVQNFTGLVSGVFLSIDSAGEKQKRYAIGYRGGKRFVKVTATPTGLTAGAPVAMLALKGNAAQVPVNNS